MVVNTTESSAPFLEALAARGRVVITATETGAQKYATVFPDYFAKALADAASDIDKNGRTSIWELFAAASGGVARHYTERAQLTTERAILSDTGDKDGRAGDGHGPAGHDGAVAVPGSRRRAPKAPTPPCRSSSAGAGRSKPRPKPSSRRSRAPTPATWAAEFERLMIELARVSRDIRQRS